MRLSHLFLSCVLCKKVCQRPDIDNHSALREFGARIIGQLVTSYISTIPSLQTRLIKVYVKSIQEENTALSTLFGALAGLAEFGDQIVESIIFPLVKSIGLRLVQIIDTNNAIEKQPADKIRDQIVEIISNVLKEKSSIIPAKFIQETNIANKQPTVIEFEYFVSEFGAFFGQLIYERLNKIRSIHFQHQVHLNANILATSNAQVKSIAISK